MVKVITSRSKTSKEENSVAINTSISGSPFLEYYKEGEWIPVDNLGSIDRLAKLDDLYTHLYRRNWCIGPRYSESYGDLYLHLGNQDSPIPVLSDGIRISDSSVTSDEITEDMNKEIDIYYNSLVSVRDFLEGSSVVDLWEYPTEYSGTLNLVTLPVRTETVIRLGVSWVMGGFRKTENITFSPWDNESKWIEFQSPLGNGEVIVEFHDGCIRVFPGIPEVTECIIHHCVATYDKLL